MDKRGEFYLVAAIIISIVVIGIVSVVNYTRTSSETNLDDFKQEMQIESSYVLDYANYNELSDTEINSLLENFTVDYINTKSQNKNMYFIFGEKSNFTFVAYQSDSETVALATSSGSESLAIEEGVIFTDYYSTDNNVTLALDGFDKEFEMKEGENFYFIMSKKIGDEKHVVSNQV